MLFPTRIHAGHRFDYETPIEETVSAANVPLFSC